MPKEKKIMKKQEKEKPIIEVLKENFEGWKISLELRKEAHKSARGFQKVKEKELKEAKRVVYLTYKQRREAQVNVLKAKRKYKGFISQRRSWAKKNYGKVLEMMEKK